MKLLSYLYITVLLNFFAVIYSRRERYIRSSEMYAINSRICGIRKDTSIPPRISYGEIAPVAAYPWMISMHDGTDYHYCGASVINALFAVSAAHCFIDPDDATPLERNFFVLTLGSNDRYAEDKITRHIKNFKLHEEFTADQLHNDIALIEMDREVDFRHTSVKPICLPPPNNNRGDIFLNEKFISAGWGYTEKVKAAVRYLLHVRIPQLDIAQCAARAAREISINSLKNVICTSSKVGEDSCFGDSGGPLMSISKGKKKLYLRGIVSTGSELCRGWSINTEVAFYVEWIKREMNLFDD